MLTRLPARSRLGIVPLLLAILLALLGVGLTPATAYGQAPQRPTATPEERAAALARPGVVFLRMNWSGYVITESGTVLNGGQPYQLGTRCTGFGVNPTGYVATAGHCVDPGIENGIGRSFLLQGSARRSAGSSTTPVTPKSFSPMP